MNLNAYYCTHIYWHWNSILWLCVSVEHNKKCYMPMNHRSQVHITCLILLKKTHTHTHTQFFTDLHPHSHTHRHTHTHTHTTHTDRFSDWWSINSCDKKAKRSWTCNKKAVSAIDHSRTYTTLPLTELLYYVVVVRRPGRLAYSTSSRNPTNALRLTLMRLIFLDKISVSTEWESSQPRQGPGLNRISHESHFINISSNWLKKREYQ